ncbi:DUF4136 domain-containing protein [Hymenobacter ruricola]|uniref:Lipoprotein n=1 Tax=Hymenobacter ruricola TaxID=2791023 RepID=A0ABS0I805_9BACT|nr:DUF4136 domain-containing protein [Hymenobacter ruricola]MBF9222823.1 hypothetical protein [Hymenobacter ruricola]
MPRFSFAILLMLSLWLAGCARRSHQAEALAPAALAAHRTVAILPFAVELERLRDLAKHAGVWARDSAARPLGSTLESGLQAERRQMGYLLQAALQAELMRQQAQRPITSTFQNPAETNQRLARAGITYESLPTRSMAELRAALGVDAVLTGQTSMHQLLPGGVSIAVFVLSNGSNPMADNSVRTALDIYDTQSGQLVWRFDHELHGKPSTSPAALAKALVRDMKDDFPYLKK